MVAVGVRIRLGLSSIIESWQETISDDVVEHFQERAAEFEVLEMALHDAHYAGHSFGTFPASHYSLPTPFHAAVDRVASSDVIGNIGEGLGVAAFCEVFGFSHDEVTRIRRQRSRLSPVARRTPDFAISVGAFGRASLQLQTVASRIHSLQYRGTYASAVGGFPDRFPLESKASMQTCNSLWSGVWQLVEYWHALEAYNPGSTEVGYGVLIETHAIGTQARDVVMTILVPKNQTELATKVQSLVHPRGTRKAFLKQFGSTVVFHGD